MIVRYLLVFISLIWYNLNCNKKIATRFLTVCSAFCNVGCFRNKMVWLVFVETWKILLIHKKKNEPDAAPITNISPNIDGTWREAFIYCSA